MSEARASRSASGYAMIAVAASSWGTWAILVKLAPMPPALQSAIVLLVVTVGCFVASLRDRVYAKRRLVHWVLVGCYGVTDALNVELFFEAYQRTSVAIAVLTHYLTPIFVALAAPVVVGERPRARTLVAVGVSFAGLVLLLEPWRAGFSRDDVAGALLGSASAVFYAASVLTNKRLVPLFSGSELMFFHGLVAVPLLFALVPIGQYAQVSTRSLAIIFAGALGPGVVAGLLFVWGLRRVPASHASVLTLLEPFVAVLLAATVLGQRLGMIPIVGGALILGAAVLVVYGGTTVRDNRAAFRSP